MTDASEAIDAHLRYEFYEGTDGRHLTTWAVVGLYEDLGDNESVFVAVTGSSNIAAHVGLLRMGEAFLINND